MKSKSSLHLQVGVQIFRKVIVIPLKKIYSIPKYRLQRAQLSQKIFCVCVPSVLPKKGTPYSIIVILGIQT